MKRTILIPIYYLFILLLSVNLYSQLVHPGLSLKESDLDRMKYMVEAKVDPWYSTYNRIKKDSRSSYNYKVQGRTSMKVIYRDSPGTNKSEFESDSRAALFNAYMWYITEDKRHAEKSIEIFNAWTGLTYVQHSGTHTLSASMIYIMLEAAEIIRHTYSGWSSSEIKKFEDMLVYPGYSNTKVPDNLDKEGTWYWRTYNGDRNRAGNQELSGWRAIMAIGVFMDNKIIYDRAMRYVSGLPHRSDDLPYESGPNINTTVKDKSQYNISYNFKMTNDKPDWGYDGVLTNYIIETGQNAESSRDQGHAGWGLNLLNHLSEIAWNQGDNLYGIANNRLLLGLEHYNRYNLSYLQSFSDQKTPWEPTVANGGYKEHLNRPARSLQLAMNPYLEHSKDKLTRGGKQTADYWGMPYHHYVGRGMVQPSKAKWLTRAVAYDIEKSGLEYTDNGASHIGCAGLTFNRPTQCYGDPIKGFHNNGLPKYSVHKMPGKVEAENFDFNFYSQNTRTYYDKSNNNSGNKYRNNEDVDIENCSEGGYNITDIENGEWLSYTVHIPENGFYDFGIRYSSNNKNNKIKVTFGGIETIKETTLPSTNGLNNWSTVNLGSVYLAKGVQSVRLYFNTPNKNSLKLNYFNINKNNEIDTSGNCSKGFNAFTIIEAESFCENKNVKIENNNQNIGNINNGEWIKFSDVDFGNNEAKSFEISASSNTEGGTVELRLGSSTGSLIGKVTITKTKNWGTYLKFSTDNIVSKKGKYDLYLVFKGGSGYLFNIDWFRFTGGVITTPITISNNSSQSNNNVSTSTSTSKVPTTGTRIEAEDFNDMTGIDIEPSSESGYNVGWINNGDWLEFSNVNLNNINSIDFRVASQFSGGIIQVRTGNKLGKIIGVARVNNTGGNQNWETVSANITSTNQKEDLFLTFIGSGNSFLFNLNWIELQKSTNTITTNTNTNTNTTTTTSSTNTISTSNNTLRIEAEDFNKMKGIQVENSTESGQNIGWIHNGDWILFNNINLTDVNAIGVRVACDYKGGQIQARLGSPSGAILARFNVTNTGGNQQWKTIKRNIASLKGTYNICLTFSGGTGYLFNVNWLELYKPNNNTTDDSIKFEAEEYDDMFGIQTESSTESGDNVGWINNNDWISFNSINLSEIQSIEYRVASPYKGGYIEVRLGSPEGPRLDRIFVSRTGGNQKWKTISHNLDSVKGNHDVYLVFTGNSGYLFNLNWIKFNKFKSKANANGYVVDYDLNNFNLIDKFNVFPTIINENTTIYNSKGTTINVMNMSGHLLYKNEIDSNNYIFDMNNYESGMYYIQISIDNLRKVFKVVKK